MKAKSFKGRKGRPTPPSDARSKNPRMGGGPSKAGYEIPFDDDTNRNPYRPGPRKVRKSM